MKSNVRSSAFILVLVVTSILAYQLGASEAGKAQREADEALNAAYGKLSKKVADPEQKKALVEAQRAWIEFRDADVEFFSQRYPTSKGGLFYLTHLTVERTKYLNALLKSNPEDEDGGPMEYQE